MAARIILIDNDKAVREFLTLGLTDEGWEVFSYAYAQIDLAALKQLHPDLFILDFNVRDSGTGWEFLQLLKMEDTTANLPILIITTAFQLPAEVKGYLLARHISVTQKPFELDLFIPLVQNTLDLASQAGLILSGARSLPILVVEDDEAMREALAIILRLEGYQVVTAGDGLVALNAVSHAEHCLILLDMVMPIMDGFEFLKAYEWQQRPHTPVVILSGEEDLLIRTLPPFVIDVIFKPYEISHLLQVVEKYAQPA